MQTLPNQTTEMQPIEALNVLDQAAGMAPLNRQGHVAVQQAVQVIAKLIQDAQKPEAPVSEIAEK